MLDEHLLDAMTALERGTTGNLKRTNLITLSQQGLVEWLPEAFYARQQQISRAIPVLSKRYDELNTRCEAHVKKYKRINWWLGWCAVFLPESTREKHEKRYALHYCAAQELGKQLEAVYDKFFELQHKRKQVESMHRVEGDYFRLTESGHYALEDARRNSTLNPQAKKETGTQPQVPKEALEILAA